MNQPRCRCYVLTVNGTPVIVRAAGGNAPSEADHKAIREMVEFLKNHPKVKQQQGDGDAQS